VRRLPDAIVACVGGGSNAIGIFDAFIDDQDVRLIGIEAGGHGIRQGRHAARFAGGSSGVLQGTRSYVLQDAHGNIEPTHSISAGLDYAAVGPRARLAARLGRAEYTSSTTTRRSRRSSGSRARRASCRRSSRRTPSRTPAASRRACRGRRAAHRQPLGPRRQGRAERPAKAGALEGTPSVAPRRTFARMRSAGRGGLVTYVTAGDPDPAGRAACSTALARGGADVIEVGVPFSDPLADGPVIQRASERALPAA
jgi:hypothetical protein